MHQRVPVLNLVLFVTSRQCVYSSPNLERKTCMIALSHFKLIGVGSSQCMFIPLYVHPGVWSSWCMFFSVYVLLGVYLGVRSSRCTFISVYAQLSVDSSQCRLVLVSPFNLIYRLQICSRNQYS